MEPLRQENDTATQVPSQDTEDKSQRSTPSERTVSTMTPPNDEVLLSSDTATDLRTIRLAVRSKIMLTGMSTFL